MSGLLTKKLPFAAVLLLLVFCMSCNRETIETKKNGTNVYEWEDTTITGDATKSQMSFNVGSMMSVERTAQTRATTDIDGAATFSTGDLVAVAVTRSGASEVVKLYSVKSDGSLEYAGGDNDPFVWKSTGETVSLRAWSYGTSTNLSYTLTAPETRDYTLETDQNSNGYLELLYCKAADKSYSGGTISLNFYHQLTRLVLNVTHERTGTLSVTSYNLGNTASFPVKASFTVPTGNSNVGTWTIGSTYNTIIPKTEATQSGYQKTYSAVIFPHTYAQNSQFFTITNSDGNYAYNISEAAGFTPAAGSQYNYTINVMDGHWKTNVSIATRSDLTVGDILCSDGYIYTAANAMYIVGENRTAIGIITYISTGANDPTCENKLALVMALKSAGSYQWGTKGVEENDTYFPNYNGSNFSQALNETVTGKAKLDYILTDGHTTHKAFEACRDFSVSTSGVSGSTGWFLPTVRQWYWTLLTLGQLSSYTLNTKQSDTTTRNNLNTAMSCVGTGYYDEIINDIYWTSTEWSALWTIFMRFTDSWIQIGATDQMDDKGLTHLVRPFLAF